MYITDQNHGYEDVDRPIARQTQPERPVVIGDGSWLGHGAVVLPGAHIGRHVVVAAGSVVTGVLPDYCVAAGSPARPIKRWSADGGWQSVVLTRGRPASGNSAWRWRRRNRPCGCRRAAR